MRLKSRVVPQDPGFVILPRGIKRPLYPTAQSSFTAPTTPIGYGISSVVRANEIGLAGPGTLINQVPADLTKGGTVYISNFAVITMDAGEYL